MHRLVQPLVDRLRLTTVFLTDPISKMGLIPLDDIDAAVRTTPINDDTLQIRVVLFQDLFNRLRQVLRLIVRRHHNADARILFTHKRPRKRS